VRSSIIGEDEVPSLVNIWKKTLPMPFVPLDHATTSSSFGKHPSVTIPVCPSPVAISFLNPFKLVTAVNVVRKEPLTSPHNKNNNTTSVVAFILTAHNESSDASCQLQEQFFILESKFFVCKK
jgi:hypothetical protein